MRYAYLLRQGQFDQEKSGEPYPLLLVRPSGIGAYCAARAAMKSWESEFGYELIDDDWQLAFDEPDEQLARLAGVALGSHDTFDDPGYDTARYGRGAYLLVPPRLKGRGERGADIGAEVLYRTFYGQRTSTPLWPWPMEERIASETGSSATWQAQGGLWKTLDGIYP